MWFPQQVLQQNRTYTVGHLSLPLKTLMSVLATGILDHVVMVAIKKMHGPITALFGVITKNNLSLSSGWVKIRSPLPFGLSPWLH